jgi:very-short-patch-repair endonuclease
MTSPIETKLERHLVPMCEALGFDVKREVRYGKYTADFVIWAALDTSVLVETDGYNFHERTPEHAEKDRKRDRFFLFAHGMPTIRFLSTEIFRNAEACAMQVIQIVSKLMRADDAKAIENINRGFNAAERRFVGEEHW